MMFLCNSLSASSTICLQVNLKKETEQNCDFPYGNDIGNMYPVLKRILFHLPYTDLRNITQISNKSWSELSRSELKKRNNVSWFQMIQNKVWCINESTNFHYDDANFVFMIYNHKLMKLNKFVCIHYMDNKVERKSFMEYLEESVLAFSANRCILSTVNLYPLLQDSDVNTCLSAVAFPTIKNIRIETITTKVNVCKNVFSLNNEEKYVCLLVFTTDHPHHTIRKFINNILAGYSSKDVALCGGITSGLKVQEASYFSRKHFYCIAFIENGQSNLQAHSIVIPETDNFEDQVKNFKESIIIYNNTVIFRITCTYKDGKSEENKVLHQYFPGIPILGMDADGEFGWNKFGNSTNYCPSPKRNTIFPTMYHGYTTVLALITWQT